MIIKNVAEISSWRLCVGCGACAYVCPEKNITLIDILDHGIRPHLNPARCTKCGDCLKVCPGYETSHSKRINQQGLIRELQTNWGPILEVWEGYATDPEIRFNGSSGGLASALSVYCIEKKAMGGVLHIAADVQNPMANRTVLSRNRTEVLSRSGSRYSPASPCDSLGLIEAEPLLSVFIGKPCDVAALRKAQSMRSELDKKVGLAIGIFCAGTPSTRGTCDLLRKLNIDPQSIVDIRYRGKGWPGKLSIKLQGEEQAREILTYMDAWSFIQKYRPNRCHLCPDATAEFADISCGDPWYREIGEGEQGYSLVLVRTEKGRKLLYSAMEAGYVSLQRVSQNTIEKSQRNLLAKRSYIFGRLMAMKLFMIPIPRLRGFFLLRSWLKISPGKKIRSILGTIRRIVQRKYYKPSKCV